MPDLTFTNLTYNISFISTNTTTSITYWNVQVRGILKNNGTIPAVASVSGTGMYRNLGGTGYGYGIPIPTPQIPAGRSTKISWSFIEPSGPIGVSFRADVFNNVTESNETNNVISTVITLP